MAESAGTVCAAERFARRDSTMPTGEILPQPRSESSTSTAGVPRRRRILVVEDDYLVALQFENALTEAGFDVVDIASTAEAGISLGAGRPGMSAVVMTTS